MGAERTGGKVVAGGPGGGNEGGRGMWVGGVQGGGE